MHIIIIVTSTMISFITIILCNVAIDSLRNCILLALLNSGMSFISGFAIFSVLGFMAQEQVWTKIVVLLNDKIN